MQSLKECFGEGFHPPVVEPFALASRSPMQIQNNNKKIKSISPREGNKCLSLIFNTLKHIHTHIHTYT